eukprot:367482-Pleurochrysis_carterae.AAC.4
MNEAREIVSCRSCARVLARRVRGGSRSLLRGFARLVLVLDCRARARGGLEAGGGARGLLDGRHVHDARVMHSAAAVAAAAAAVAAASIAAAAASTAFAIFAAALTTSITSTAASASASACAEQVCAGRPDVISKAEKKRTLALGRGLAVRRRVVRLEQRYRHRLLIVHQPTQKAAAQQQRVRVDRKRKHI